MTLDVIYRDDRILVLNKPVGLLSVPGIGPEIPLISPCEKTWTPAMRRGK
jgi:23S rRNA-/tRNA-specific pseudouridylate synthase